VALDAFDLSVLLDAVLSSLSLTAGGKALGFLQGLVLTASTIAYLLLIR
jgi:hypothetical protein